MSSLLGAPFQMINMAVEVLFLLDHRLRDQVQTKSIEEGACLQVFEAVTSKVLEAMDGLFTPRKLLSFEAQSQLFKACFEQEMLRIPTESFEKLFRISLMSVKVQVLRCGRISDLVDVTEDKLRELGDIIKSEKLRGDISKLKDEFIGFYGSLSIGGMARLRNTLINFLKDARYPVTVLIAEGYQDENGDICVSAHGPNSANLGAAVLYGQDGSISDEYVLPIVGKTICETDPYVGPWNLYSMVRELERDTGRSPVSGCSRNREQGASNRDLADCPRTYAKKSSFDTRRSSVVSVTSESKSLSYAERLEANKKKASPCSESSRPTPLW